MARETIGHIDLKIGLHTQLDSKNMGSVPLAKPKFSGMYICVHVCLCVSNFPAKTTISKETCFSG